jgi:hypothetical protein
MIKKYIEQLSNNLPENGPLMHIDPKLYSECPLGQYQEHNKECCGFLRSQHDKQNKLFSLIDRLVWTWP